uniref:Potassium channel domain-containing protein n=1 Tax=Glossina brevipalpis TaxID=37001 RepID=A0A1A9W3N8_9MUSC
MDPSDYSDNANIRRRRRIGRSVREKTPEPSFRKRTSAAADDDDDDNSRQDLNATSEDNNSAQVISMQIRPPRPISAHESKILRRRDKTFASAASRSLSQPREAEKLSDPEANEIIRIVKRSRSMPRKKADGESSEGEVLSRERTLSPQTKPSPSRNSHQREEKEEDRNLSRLRQNMARFEEERKHFEIEKRLFELEKREKKLRHRPMFDSDDRRRLLQNYRLLADRLKLPQTEKEKLFSLNGSKLERADTSDTPIRSLQNRRPRRSIYDESSTQFSSSDAETSEEIKLQHLAKQLSPVRRHNSALSKSQIHAPPPQPPTRRSVSRNNSLSPPRPRRISKTAEQIADTKRKPSERENNNYLMTTDLESEKEPYSRPQPPPRRRDSLTSIDSVITKPARKTKQHLEKNDQIDGQSQVDEPVSIPDTKHKIFFYQRIVEFFQKPQTVGKEKKQDTESLPQGQDSRLFASKAFFKAKFLEYYGEWKKMKADHPQELQQLKKLRNKCFGHVITLVLMIGFGGLMFRYTEGSAENIYKCEVRKVKRDFIDALWTHSHYMREEDWKSLARQKLRKFEEELHHVGELGIRYFPGQKSWNFVNCILYCWTVITTIGYGHITPKTTLGQSLTIIYAIIGIPMFLILLADFGKLFTRGFKFVWGFVRRLYYTGTCRKIRKQQQVRDAMTGFSAVYDMAIRRPSHFLGMRGDGPDLESQASEAGKSHPETPSSPYPDTIIVDDEFNLPISLASLLLISYILFGTFVYTLWEDWTYFEAFYFVFISMSTIGFGDFVPNHPIFMMCSIIYLVFGLALTSMFINVVQIKLSDTFKQASAKIGVTIGLGMASEAGDNGSQMKTPSDVASVHGLRLNKITEDDNENKITPSPPEIQSILRGSRPNSPTNNNENDDNSDPEGPPPPLLPRRQVAIEQPPQVEKKKKKYFFK